MKRAFPLLMIFLMVSIVSATNLSEPELDNVCNNLYYFIISNNYNYTNNEFQNLSTELNISIEILNNHLDNYETFCIGYSDTLPKRELPTLIIYKKYKQKNSCDLEIHPILEADLPFFEIYLGDKNCNSMKALEYVFSIEEDEDTYTIKGFKIWWIMFIVFLLFAINVIKTNAEITKALRRK